MAKLNLKADPTFDALVDIAVPGKEAVKVSFTFKHRTRAEVAKWLEQSANDDVATVMECASGWELDDEFSADNVALLCQNYIAAPGAIVRTYLEELRGARAKN